MDLGEGAGVVRVHRGDVALEECCAHGLGALGRRAIRRRERGAQRRERPRSAEDPECEHVASSGQTDSWHWAPVLSLV